MIRIFALILCLVLARGISTRADTTDATMMSDSLVFVASADTIVKNRNILERIINYLDKSNKPASDKKFDFSIIAGPSYSADTKFSVAVLGAAQYKHCYDSLTPLSDAAIYAQVSTTGYYQVGIRGVHIGPENRWRIPYDVSFESYPTYFWGIGYDNDIEDANETKFKQLTSYVIASMEWQVIPNLFVGPAGTFQYAKATSIAEPEPGESGEVGPGGVKLWRGEPLRVLNLGVGFTLSYDTRDYISNAFKGVYLGLEQRFFPGGMLNDRFFGLTELTFNCYNQVWKGGILAGQIHGRFTYGDTPWPMLSSFGGAHSMRGYYKARFRDKNEVDATLELRQHIYKRSSAVAWVGIGNVFPSFKEARLRETLPNYGVGYRWEFKKRTNLRVDIGFGRGCKGVEFNISEVF